MITIGTRVGFSLIKKDNNHLYVSKDERIWDILKINKVHNTKHTKYITSFKNLSKKYNQKTKQKNERNAIFNDIENNQNLLD